MKLLNIFRKNLKILCFFQVMNESARIARGPVRPLSQLTADDAEAVVIPGGFGAAKNLSDFGFKGESKVI
jgi:enhancing lycopene biosynthesis protein 2